MNMANMNNEELDFDYSVDFVRRQPKEKVAPGKTRNKASYARAGRAPVSHNGMHRRRNKRFSW